MCTRVMGADNIGAERGSGQRHGVKGLAQATDRADRSRAPLDGGDGVASVDTVGAFE